MNAKLEINDQVRVIMASGFDKDIVRFGEIENVYTFSNGQTIITVRLNPEKSNNQAYFLRVRSGIDSIVLA